MDEDFDSLLPQSFINKLFDVCLTEKYLSKKPFVSPFLLFS